MDLSPQNIGMWSSQGNLIRSKRLLKRLHWRLELVCLVGCWLVGSRFGLLMLQKILTSLVLILPRILE